MPVRILLILTLIFYAPVRSLSQIKRPPVPQQNNYQPIGTPLKVNGWPISSNNSIKAANIDSIIAKKQEEIAALLQNTRERSGYASTQDHHYPVAHTENFQLALNQLKDMLTGKTQLSLANAYYIIEKAYGNVYLTKEQYDNIVAQSAAFIKTWMVQNKLNLKDSYMVQYAIQRFMSEPLVISKIVNHKDKGATMEVIQHEPFHYDYNDYTGTADYRNTFLTKCLATGFGQCGSMPAVYLLLAEAMGVKAYLSATPHHSFIKYPDNKGNIVNYEATTNWEISDKWYMDNMFISKDAIVSGIYLDTLNTRQIIANCIFDLAVEYVITDKTGDDTFLLNCLEAGNPYFPQNNNLTSLFLYSMHLKNELLRLMRSNHISSIDDIDNVPLAQKYYQQYLKTEAHITTLGYRELPEGMYKELMLQQEAKAKTQNHYNISGKHTKNLFIKGEYNN
ncbi:hypothetical protein [Chitinophaga silvisoli]|uniref:Protein SirB1 N-terminal domain-containing protein n=1 Tax=Chitinophaga silvisoli TaxID=2291814 RepID=A0A3E1P3R9_9BACT|nr:hypothetical protein [Chitinophaga silvisoli]RFM34770.1 hypothetical protein DXN04_11035 [Chitinophaga silvisoli]